MATSEKQVAYHLRMPESLKKQIAELADSNDRSINAEIVNRLKKSLDKGEHQHKIFTK